MKDEHTTTSYDFVCFVFLLVFFSCVTPQQISIKEKAHKEETTIVPQQYNRLFPIINYHHSNYDQVSSCKRDCLIISVM